MLGREPFRHDILRKYEIVFGALFNEIFLTRRDSDGNTNQLIKVPLSWAPKEKVLARVFADPAIDRQTSAIMPRLAFELTDISYQGDNKLRSSGRHMIRLHDEGDEGKLTSMFNPVPYDLKFTLWAFVKYLEDGNQIAEQILPFFTPNFTATVNLIDDVVVDCQVRLDRAFPQDLYKDKDWMTKRGVMWTFEFTMTAYLFGPVHHHPIIKFADVGFFIPSEEPRDEVGTLDMIDRVTVQPAMTANGDATTNVDISVAYSEIDASDDWDYGVTIYGSLVPGDIGGGEGE